MSVRTSSRIARGWGGGGGSVSATTVSTVPGVGDPRTDRSGPEPYALKVLAWSLGAFAVGCLAFDFTYRSHVLGQNADELLIWIGLVLSADLMSVRFAPDLGFSVSLPVLLAVAILYPPSLAAMVPLVGYADYREWRKEISLTRGVFNRGQISFTVFSASAVFHALGTSSEQGPSILLPVALAVVANYAINTGLVAVGMSLAFRLPLRESVRTILGTSPRHFCGSYLILGLLSVPLVMMFKYAGDWGLIAGIVPVVVAGEMMLNANRHLAAARTVALRDRLLAAAAQRVSEERRDERMIVAASLHDDVVQPLYKVHLMCQVLRRDLEAGAMDALAQDLHELTDSADLTSGALRSTIHDLRQSSLGPGGLLPTLRLLITQIRSETSAQVEAVIDELLVPPPLDLVIYQVAREALRNAVSHGDPHSVRVQLARTTGSVQLVVEDDGCGFDVQTVNGHEHFGLQLMRERAAIGGGTLELHTLPGAGTRVTLEVPLPADFLGD